MTILELVKREYQRSGLFGAYSYAAPHTQKFFLEKVRKKYKEHVLLFDRLSQASDTIDNAYTEYDGVMNTIPRRKHETT